MRELSAAAGMKPELGLRGVTLLFCVLAVVSAAYARQRRSWWQDRLNETYLTFDLRVFVKARIDLLS